MSAGNIYSNEQVKIPAIPIAKKSTGRLTVVFVICFLSTMSGGIVSMLMSVYLPVAVKDLLGNVSDDRLNDVSAWINALFIFGWMAGGIVWGIICDKTGRSKSVILSTACFGLFAILTGQSSSWFFVSACRFLSGFGIGGVLVTTVILIAELWTGKKIAIIQGIVSLAMPVGFFVAGAINNGVENWRAAFWIGIIPLLLALIAAFTLPESEEWKKRKQRTRLKENTDQRLFSAGNRKNLLIGSVVFGTMLIGLWAVFSWAPTWVQSISASADVQQQRGLTMMLLAAGGIAGSFFSGWIVNAIGLVKTMLICFAACFIMTFVVFKLNNNVTVITFSEMAVLAFFFGISQGALAVYIPALFPTGICASATGFCFNAGRLFTGTVVFFIGALVSWLGGYGNAVFIFSFVLAAGFIATLLSRKMKTS
ncbi:MAG: MFS transporter [Bacteroidota bacterium]|nr:MFS transporter [Bacteroidota bacterium]